MGSPLSPVLACLFMEMLEADHFLGIIGPNTLWVRYVDDVLLITDNDQDLTSLLGKINSVHRQIQFTCEEEQNGKIPFLDTLIIKCGTRLRFTVYRKPTNKNDFIHFFSAHSKRTKTGVVLGFFLRAFRICSEEYLEEELAYLRQIFSKLGYPLGLLYDLQRRAIKIRSRKANQKSQNIEVKKQYISVPASREAEAIANFTRGILNVSPSTGSTIKTIIQSKNKTKNTDQDSVVYRIPCGACNKCYIGETYRGAAKRVDEHKRDLRYHRETNAIVQHADKEGHLPNWAGVEILCTGLDKQLRQAAEAAYIGNIINFNGNVGKVKLSRYTSRMILHKCFRK